MDYLEKNFVWSAHSGISLTLYFVPHCVLDCYQKRLETFLTYI